MKVFYSIQSFDIDNIKKLCTQEIMYSDLWLKKTVPKKVLGENDQRADSEPDP